MFSLLPGPTEDVEAALGESRERTRWGRRSPQGREPPGQPQQIRTAGALREQPEGPLQKSSEAPAA